MGVGTEAGGTEHLLGIAWNALEQEGGMGEGTGGELLEKQSVHMLGTICISHAHGGGNKCIMECIILCSVLQRNLEELLFFSLRK